MKKIHVKPKHQRLIFISFGLFCLGIAVYLTLVAFQDSLVFYYTPSELVLKKNIPPQQRLRIGGLVEIDSLKQSGPNVSFRITDNNETVKVNYQGVLPDLFREGQGVVAEGYLSEPHKFKAETVLAKHDERYMPKEVADQLKKSNQWRHAK